MKNIWLNKNLFHKNKQLVKKVIGLQNYELLHELQIFKVITNETEITVFVMQSINNNNDDNTTEWLCYSLNSLISIYEKSDGTIYFNRAIVGYCIIPYLDEHIAMFDAGDKYLKKNNIN